MKRIIPHLVNALLLGTALVATVAVTPALRADDKVYHDKGHKDDHTWNDREDKAYRMYLQENHHKYVDFQKMKAADQERYWTWRHNHSDALLKIDIR